jgi:2-hydroxy-3-oxopropionate reductase
MKAGFIGLGLMGRPMAANLLKAGYELHVHSRRRAPEDLTLAGAVECTSGADVARAADVIITMVPDTPDVESVLFGENGVASGLTPGKLVIDMSSISPFATRDFAARINALGCDYLDAPVSGGDIGAKAASLTIMVGGPQQAFDRALPLFQAMGKNITLIGGNGDGQIAKIANQIIVAATIEAVGEALLFSAKAGADPQQVRKALMGGFASSRILEVHGERMIKRSFDPGFRIELHHKDLDIALASAEALGVPLPNTELCRKLFDACIAQGGAKWDHSAMVRALEAMADYEIASAPATR